MSESRASELALRVSPHAVFHRLPGGRIAAWNRFAPLVVVVEEDVLAALGNGAPAAAIASDGVLSDADIGSLVALGIVDRGVDSTRSSFYRTLESRLSALDERAEDRRRLGEPYGNLYLTNTACNLGCTYCVARHANADRTSSLVRLPRAERSSFAIEIVDAYMRHRVESGETLTPISFNGGEILLEWEMITDVVAHVRRCFPKMEMRFLLNTNMTLMDRDRAEFLIHNDFEVHLSIDGYQQAHDQTRRFKDGRGSFDQIIDRVRMFNSLGPRSPITGFQGTIDRVDSFDSEKLFSMANHGFVQARLAPNLIGVTERDGCRKADLEAELYELGLGCDLEITEAYFLTVRKLIDADEYSFFFNCLGLSAYPSVGLHVNVETRELSLLCGFITAAAVSHSDLERDLHSPLLWKAARRFIRERAAALRGVCSECDVIGVCRGSCILMGLDYRNRLNPGACAYQRQLWRRSIELAHRYDS